MNTQEEIETVDRDTLQKRIGYFERTIHSLCEAEEQETDFERLTKISQLIEDARYELISLQLELNEEQPMKKEIKVYDDLGNFIGLDEIESSGVTPRKKKI